MKLNLLIFLAYIMITISFTNCKNSERTHNTQVTTSNIPSDFASFYDRFHADSTFQLSHIQFPLAGRNDSLSTTWERQNWRLHIPFDTTQITFRRQFYNLNNIIIEKIKDGNGYFSTEKRYSKLSDDDWYLIYYGIETNL